MEELNEEGGDSDDVEGENGDDEEVVEEGNVDDEDDEDFEDEDDDNGDEDGGEADENGFEEEVEDDDGGHWSSGSDGGDEFMGDDDNRGSESSTNSDVYRRTPRNFDHICSKLSFGGGAKMSTTIPSCIIQYKNYHRSALPLPNHWKSFVSAFSAPVRVQRGPGGPAWNENFVADSHVDHGDILSVRYVGQGVFHIQVLTVNDDDDDADN
ncbi:nucleoplasmin-like protein ANO39 [Chenopodium quinoa]|uniref:nucleoplasmin-like protein ANO39 n=1 Tax=Chenopodium quinoa TaxID=63459 RepID=UPI000B76FB64|nr:nucleoplasmin-like protein ANO39 [Chenopodium quinoa]